MNISNAISQAQWLTAPEDLNPPSLPGTETQGGLYLDFVFDFDWSGDKKVSIQLTANSIYQLFCNEKFLGRGPAPGSRFLRWLHEYDLDELNVGLNRIAVRVFHDGERTQTVQGFRYGKPGLLAAITQDDQILGVTDHTWKVRRSPDFSPVTSMASRWGGFKEFYHGDKSDNWKSLFFDTSGWESAPVGGNAIHEEFAFRIEPMTLPPLRKDDLNPVRLVDATPRGGFIELNQNGDQMLPLVFHSKEYGSMPEILLDFGKEVVGHPVIEIEGGNAIIEVWYGESMDMYRLDIIRFFNTTKKWQAFHRRAFRFLKIAVIYQEGPIKLTKLYHKNEMFNFPLVQYDKQVDPLFREIVEVSDYTLRISSSYHFEGCPLREPDIWIFDARIMSLMSMYLYGQDPLGPRSLRQMFALQKEDGGVPSMGPLESLTYLPDFVLHLVLMLHEQFIFGGDMQLLEELYPKALKIDNFIRKYLQDDGLLSIPAADQPYVDWGPGIQRIGKTVFMNALFVDYLKAMASMAAHLNRDTERDRFIQESNKIKDSIIATFFDEQNQIFTDLPKWESASVTSLQGNIMVLASGIVDEVLGKKIISKIFDSGRYKLPYGPSFFLMIFEALNRYNENHRVKPLIEQYWKPMLERDARTWWEVFDPESPHGFYPHPFLGNTPTLEMDWIPVSHVHAWSGVAVIGIMRNLQGKELTDTRGYS